MKKTRFFLFISLFVVSAILLSSCSSKLSVAKSFDAVLNKDYSPEPEITEEISEISELKDMNFLDSKGEFIGIYEYCEERNDYKPVKMFYENN